MQAIYHAYLNIQFSSFFNDGLHLCWGCRFDEEHQAFKGAAPVREICDLDKRKYYCMMENLYSGTSIGSLCMAATSL